MGGFIANYYMVVGLLSATIGICLLKLRNLNAVCYYTRHPDGSVTGPEYNKPTPFINLTVTLVVVTALYASVIGVLNIWPQ